MADNFFLKRGQRGLLVGQTGSGKSVNGYFQLRNSATWPIFIFDTKMENDFYSIPQHGESILTVESLDAFKALVSLPRKHLPDYILVRPSIDEMADTVKLDEYCDILYNSFGSLFAYFDELYTWHNNGKPGKGMIALLTRGRSKGKTLLGATQRPSWISRFWLTEASKYYIHALYDERDKKTISEVIPGFQHVAPFQRKHQFYFYSQGDTNEPMLYNPVPLVDLVETMVRNTGRWL